jgi:hypothetical protein
MIRHQTIRRDAYTSSLMGFGENFFKTPNNRRAYRTIPTDRHVGSAHDRLSHPLKGEVGAAFSSCIYRIKRFFVKKRLLTPFGFPVADRIIAFPENVGRENIRN